MRKLGRKTADMFVMDDNLMQVCQRNRKQFRERGANWKLLDDEKGRKLSNKKMTKPNMK